MTDRDPSIGADGLTRRDRDLIRAVLARYPEVRRITLFGSRAMGTFGRGSDIDLALEGPDLDARTLTRIATELEDSDLPYKVDLLLRDDQLEPKLEAHIRRYGKPFGWRRSTWGEEISLEYGKSLRDYADVTSGFRVFGTNGPIGWTGKPMADGPGVILGRKGAYRGVHFSPDPFFVIDTAYYVVPKTGLDIRWLYYAMIHYQLGQIDDGSPIPSTTRAAVYPREIVVPPLDEQCDIARVLGALDDKIEQNQRTAQVLERLARAIFRAWFVDFEPVKAKAEGAATFPSMPQPVFDALPTRFVDSPIGPVPEGWAVKAATDVAMVAIGKTPPRKEPQWFTNDHSQMPWVSIRDMGVCGAFIRTTSEYLTHEAVERFNIRRVPDRSVLLSFKLTLGRVAIADGVITTNEAIAHFTPIFSDSIGAEYLYCYLIEFDHNKLGSTSSIATATNSKVVKGMPVLAPALSVAKSFTDLVRPMFDGLCSLARESRKVAEMRDYLLPKLLSGEVRVEANQTHTAGMV